MFKDSSCLILPVQRLSSDEASEASRLSPQASKTQSLKLPRDFKDLVLKTDPRGFEDSVFKVQLRIIEDFSV